MRPVHPDEVHQAARRIALIHHFLKLKYQTQYKNPNCKQNDNQRTDQLIINLEPTIYETSVHATLLKIPGL